MLGVHASIYAEKTNNKVTCQSGNIPLKTTYFNSNSEVANNLSSSKTLNV